jgi:hypothetical protein
MVVVMKAVQLLMCLTTVEPLLFSAALIVPPPMPPPPPLVLLLLLLLLLTMFLVKPAANMTAAVGGFSNPQDQCSLSGTTAFPWDVPLWRLMAFSVQ